MPASAQPSPVPPRKIGLNGRDLLECPVLNKDNAFDARERDLFGLHGLLPHHVATLEQQVARATRRLAALPDNFSRHVALREIQDRNETLFHAIVAQSLEEYLPIIYTPCIGRACQQFSQIWTRPRGLFLSYEDRGRIAEILSDARWDDVRVIVASDGGSILGIGDQGANGMGIPIGKLALYTACGGLDPACALPVLLDVGTDNEALLRDPDYIGWRHRRVRGAEHDAFIAEFVAAVEARWPRIALHWEDLAGEDALRILDLYRGRMCTYNDDIQGTAGVTTGALLAAIRAGAAPLAQQRIVIFGAGGAGCGIADLLSRMMVAEGMDVQEARSRFFMIDVEGLVRHGMAGITQGQEPFAQPHDIAATWTVRDPAHVSLSEVMAHVQPTMLIGTSGQGGAFTCEIIAPMTQRPQRPVIFALSNPTANIEATPADLLEWTDGRAIIGTGGPFAPVVFDGRKRPVDQINNSYVFPGVGLAVVAGGITRMTDGMFLAAARALAELSPAAGARDVASAALLPPVSDLPRAAIAVARAVIRQGQAEGVAPPATPEAIEDALEQAIWTARYRPYAKAGN
ncbi:NAD-dependent malic enzyme [Gluconacetobacter entanii]|uniref:NAD-dependent malic enzyme n=1 Tax=Gluconacetobacter entanii TaxID=108528 RepID=UPI001C936B37|nr:NAD-dependent malic enzyme [Gluconacetobacter entanii]MBY4639013.1 NAD-dependent malic enzyme [Gluconacetobacter entanii]MCW4580807.1 NAD-dependent malic enzyme [Gluconacetobacter entanii]MCW4584136.1 NAD-dependent malic enzyme [Gluconacetobacter entanii]MCW4587481.1 NAD-dependent malic enzyme [Gluconacetobacter entanii]